MAGVSGQPRVTQLVRVPCRRWRVGGQLPPQGASGGMIPLSSRALLLDPLVCPTHVAQASLNSLASRLGGPGSSMPGAPRASLNPRVRKRTPVPPVSLAASTAQATTAKQARQAAMWRIDGLARCPCLELACLRQNNCGRQRSSEGKRNGRDMSCRRGEEPRPPRGGKEPGPLRGRSPCKSPRHAPEMWASSINQPAARPGANLQCRRRRLPPPPPPPLYTY